jgi:hypothetical protein
MLAGFLAFGHADRDTAADRFTFAAEALDGEHDARDVVEALVGLACVADDGPQRRSALARLAQARRRGAITLLPRERALLSAAGVPPPD